jgi:hypothetical protein
MKINYLLLLALIFSSSCLLAQGKFNVKGFGSIEQDFEYHEDNEELHRDIEIGEQSLFVSGNMGRKFSFLGEFAINYSVSPHGTSIASSFTTSVRRARIRCNYIGNHSLIIGKMHTPTNYWNDVYYHARIFYPTTDRPLAFTYFLPIHSTGIRAQGQNLGKLNFGYDVATGNALEAQGEDPSIVAALHIKPTDGMRIGASYYYNHIENNSEVHHIHQETHLMTSEYAGALDYQLISFSFARFEKKLEILDEFTTALARTDTLGMAQSYSNYLYVGYKIKERYTPYVFCDFLHSAENDLRNGAFNQLKYGIGYNHEFTPLFNVKFQMEHYTSIQNLTSNNEVPNRLEFTIQLAYAIY